MPRNANIAEQAEGWDAAVRGDAPATCPYAYAVGDPKMADWFTGYRTELNERKMASYDEENSRYPQDRRPPS